MKKKLIAGLMLLTIGYAASQVMSQSPSPKRKSFPEPAGHRDAAGFREGFNDEIQRIREKLADNIAMQGEPVPRDITLMKALDKYIASDKLSKIIIELDDFAKQSPETDEGKKAMTAIQILKGEPSTVLAPTPDPNTFRSAPIYEVVEPKSRLKNADEFGVDR